MTVFELIRKLMQYDPDQNVRMETEEGDLIVRVVYKDLYDDPVLSVDD